MLDMHHDQSVSLICKDSVLLSAYACCVQARRFEDSMVWRWRHQGKTVWGWDHSLTAPCLTVKSM